MKKLTTEEFIMMARDVHGDKYDYSKVVYVNATTKVCIICPIHGEFWQTPDNHLHNHGCPLCSKNKRLTKDEFIKRARQIHSDKYDYSKVEYVNFETKVCIICPEHGEFYQTPNNHLLGYGCRKCGNQKISNALKSSTEEFIVKARKVHGDKYDYSKVLYINNNTKVCIICPIHGEFWQKPCEHLDGCGCKKCWAENIGKSLLGNKEDFIEKAIKIHGDKYDYSKVVYVNNHTKVCIICPEHGEFWQTPNNHLNRNGCPKCKESKLEKSVSCILSKALLPFESQYRQKEIFGKQSLDFYLPKYKIAIECQGIQHFEDVKFFKHFLSTRKNDKNKKKLCEENGIKLLYFTNLNYDEFLGEPLIKTENQLLEKINEIITTKTTI